MTEAIKKLIIRATGKIKNRDDLEALKREFCKKYRLKSITNSNILTTYRNLLSNKAIKKDEFLEKLLRKRSIRTLSGIAPVAVLTKPYPCPGQCAYCPHQEDVPVSYLSNEPAVMRAIRCGYDPYKQVVWRLQALENNGHEPTKIEIIVIGGTWSYLPKKYKYWYITNVFRAANDFYRIKHKKDSKLKNLSLDNLKAPYKLNISQEKLEHSLQLEQKKNERSWYRIIGLTLETRPDYINETELKEMRSLGCTRIEVGVQAIDDNILQLNKRGHGVEEIVRATNLMRRYGFKITYHFMPALPGSSPSKDFKMFKQLFSDYRFQPDQIKFYPTVVVQGSLLYDWFKQGKYKPYTDKQLQDLIIKCKQIVPRYVRIIRLIRDIPGESIEAGNKITNLRQIMKDKGVICNCIRCREAKDSKLDKWHLDIEEYEVSSGKEYFISVNSDDKKTLFGFCRLFINKESSKERAIIRELHVYGELTTIGKDGKVQHVGLGKSLLKEAEKIATDNNIYQVSVISGVGVRCYYRKQGYRLQNTYMVKNL
jgi:elongator complex protein 3